MLRSLYAGVTGLAGNIVELDVVGNNIANVNTIGFKSGRVTFQEILTQNLRPATRPAGSGGLGGTNPQQIGLGTVVGSIDNEFSQGNIRTTGNKTDLAIQGDGFFILNDGTSQFYTRAGNFTFDGDNYLVSASTGMRAQGVIADNTGQFTAAAMQDIQIDPSTVVPAEATTEVNVFGNLSSVSDATGTRMLTTSPLLAQAVVGDDLRFLNAASDGDNMSLTTGDVIALTGLVGTTGLSGLQFEVGENGDGTTIDQLLTFMSTELSTAAGSPINVTLNAAGELEIDNTSPLELENIRLSVGGSVEFNQVMSFGSIIASGQTATSSDAILTPADETDILSEILNGSGDPLNFEFVDVGGGRMLTSLEIGGTLGSEGITPNVMDVEEGVTSVRDLLDRITQALSIANEENLEMNENGHITVTGDVGEANSIGNISLREQGNLFSNLNAAMNFQTVSAAEDAREYAVTSVIYDSLGDPHNLTMSFTKRTGFNTWDWEASFDGDEEIITGGRGTVSFDESGSIVSFLYTDGGGQITMRPQSADQQGAAIMNISINPGEIGGVTGLTQYEPEDQLQSYADGFTVGRLIEFDIDQRGVIVGRFSNDTVRDMARLGVARFNNPNGLTRVGNNAYGISGNTGQAIVGFGGEGGMGDINSGALEASNVDLSEQFTRLVVAQRAFQSSSRVITTSDEVLQELVNIV